MIDPDTPVGAQLWAVDFNNGAARVRLRGSLHRVTDTGAVGVQTFSGIVYCDGSHLFSSREDAERAVALCVLGT